MKHNLQSTLKWNYGEMIARHLSLWKESCAAAGMLVWVVQIQCSPDIKSSTWHKLLFNLYNVFSALSTCFALHL